MDKEIKTIFLNNENSADLCNIGLFLFDEREAGLAKNWSSPKIGQRLYVIRKL